MTLTAYAQACQYAPAGLNKIVTLANLAQDYLIGRINDNDYVEGATALGLSRDDAICRVMALDDRPPAAARAKYRRDRRQALRAVSFWRGAKQDGDTRSPHISFEFWQMELVRLRREYYGAKDRI
jgi:hypothetical protein